MNLSPLSLSRWILRHQPSFVKSMPSIFMSKNWSRSGSKSLLVKEKNLFTITAGLLRKKASFLSTYRCRFCRSFGPLRRAADSVLWGSRLRRRFAFCSGHLIRGEVTEVGDEGVTVEFSDRLSQWLGDSIKSEVVANFLQMSLKITFSVLFLRNFLPWIWVIQHWFDPSSRWAAKQSVQK